MEALVDTRAASFFVPCRRALELRLLPLLVERKVQRVQLAVDGVVHEVLYDRRPPGHLVRLFSGKGQFKPCLLSIVHKLII